MLWGRQGLTSTLGASERGSGLDGLFVSSFFGTGSPLDNSQEPQFLTQLTRFEGKRPSLCLQPVNTMTPEKVRSRGRFSIRGAS